MMLYVAGRKNPVLTRTDRLRFNLGGGECEWPEPRVIRPVGPGGALTTIGIARLSVTYGRLLTLGAVDEVEPGVLDDLDAQPFEALNRSSWNAERDGLLRYEVILTNPRLRDLRASLETWSDRWHLNDKWCLGIAVSTLTQKSGGERLAWFEPRTHFGGMAPPFPAPFPPPFGLRPYDPAREWRADYLDHARRVLNPKYQALEREMIMCLDATNCASFAIEQDRLLAHALGLAIRRDRSFYPRRSKLDCQEPSLPPSDIFRYVKDNLANLS